MKRASAETVHHCAAQCKDATDGHQNFYILEVFFFFIPLHQATQWPKSGAAHRRQRCRTSWQAGLQAGRRPPRLAKLCLSLFSNFSILAFDSKVWFRSPCRIKNSPSTASSWGKSLDLCVNSSDPWKRVIWSEGCTKPTFQLGSTLSTEAH